MLSTYLFIAIGLLTLTLADTWAADSIKATVPSDGLYYEVPLRMGMEVLAHNGVDVGSYRIGTAHPYTILDYPHTPGMSLKVGASHNYFLWPESLNVPGNLAEGTLALDQTKAAYQVSDVLFTNAALSSAKGPYSRYALFGNSRGVISVLPTKFPPTDGTIISDAAFYKLGQFESVHLFAKRFTDGKAGNLGVLRFGGPKPYEHPDLNITGNEQCWCLEPMSSLPAPKQNIDSYRYTIQVNLILQNGTTIYKIPPEPQGCQIDTLYPFIQVVETDNSLQKIMSHFTPAAKINSEGMAEVDCSARFDAVTAIHINTTPFDINPVDMVVKNPFNDGRCFSAYQPQQTQGLYKIGWPFLYNVGVTFDFNNMLYNITSRPYY